LGGFVALMNCTPAEEDVHRYLVRYPALLPLCRQGRSKVYSKFALAAGSVADFAFVHDDMAGAARISARLNDPTICSSQE
jgi:hypothetical protein